MSDFPHIMTDTFRALEIAVSTEQLEQLSCYYEMLTERNRSMNLTALTEPRDVALKHFGDSLLLLRYFEINPGASIIDVGTGAGFPGVVLKIARPDLRLTLLDSLQKRLTFLSELCEALGLRDVAFVHSRAEDGARTALRDSFDYAVARAVAPLNILSELCLPYVRPGGTFIAMKGRDAAPELREAENALDVLCGRVDAIHTFPLLDAGERSILCIRKTAPTPAAYPRTVKKIGKHPL